LRPCDYLLPLQDASQDARAFRLDELVGGGQQISVWTYLQQLDVPQRQVDIP
jgi:hypothetical protein